MSSYVTHIWENVILVMFAKYYKAFLYRGEHRITTSTQYSDSRGGYPSFREEWHFYCARDNSERFTDLVQDTYYSMIVITAEADLDEFDIKNALYFMIYEAGLIPQKDLQWAVEQLNLELLKGGLCAWALQDPSRNMFD